jgi:hypothetical protein
MMDALIRISGKLKRANENIRKLAGEINRMFQAPPYAGVEYEDSKALQEAIDEHEGKRRFHRFGVLSGEIIHHLRSSLDHVVWQLSSEMAHSSIPDRIEFPIFKERPVGEGPLSRYNRKIEGIPKSNIGALALIKSVQPYNGAHPLDDPLWIIHDMDRIDKHREIIVVAYVFPYVIDEDAVRFVTNQVNTGITHEVAMARLSKRQMQMNPKLSPQVAFRQFGERECQPVIPSLLQLASYIRSVVYAFRDYFDS